MTLKIGTNLTSNINSDSAKNLPANFTAQKLKTNSELQNQTAIASVTNRFNDDPSSKTSRELTTQDFLQKVLSEQPVKIDDQNKSKVRAVMNLDRKSSAPTRDDYNTAFRREVYRQAMSGLKMTDEEIRMADKALIDAGLYQTYFNLQGTLENLEKSRAQSGNQMPVTIGRENIEYARRAGQAIMQYREYQSLADDARKEYARRYVNEAFGGFIQPIVNAPVNIANGLSEPFRAGERALFGTNYIPEIPRMQVAERSDYWNKDNRMLANRIGEIGATVTFGGAAGSRMLATQTGRTILGIESSYNIGAGLAGKDITQTDEQGNPREMTLLERSLRVTGGLFGARQVIKTEISTPNSAVNKLDDIFTNNTPKPQTEMVTPDGLRLKVSRAEELKNSNVLEMRGDYRINIRNGDGSKGSGLDYAWRRHGPTSTPQNKSIFSISKEELKQLLQRKDVIQSPAVKSSTSGNYIRQVDVGKVIGNIPVQKGGQSTSVLTIITDEAGNLVNTFPGTENFGATIP